MRTEDQNSTLGFPIFADDSSAIGAGKTGLTITATLAKNGGTASSVSPTITELGNGIYWVTPISAHRNTIGCNVWQFSATGAVIAPAFERIRVAPVVPGDAMALTSGERTTTATSIWENATRTLTTFPNVTVGAYATGQDPASFLSSTVTKVTSIDMLLTALTEVVDTVTRFKAAALSQAPSGGGAGDASQATLEDVQTAVNALGVALAGNSPVEPTGRIANGGRVLAYVGDDFTVRSETALPIPVKDPAGGLYTLLTAIGVDNLAFGASLPGKPAGLITGTIAEITQSGSGSSQLCNISVEITDCGVGLKPSEDYEWQIQSTQTHDDETDSLIRLEGMLSLRRNVVG